jgi:hypothetical protein
VARCPFAIWRPISGSSGAHVGGPFKIVHHTTEGSSAEGAMGAFRSNRSDPHFTVDAVNIFQHIDTAEGARALRNQAGGVQTNRDSAVQIELVGFAHLPKDRRSPTSPACAAGSSPRTAFRARGLRACRGPLATAEIPAVTTATRRSGTARAGITDTATFPRTRIGIPATRKAK